ncbi:MAG TPA: hypothetical protein VGK67_10015 [Myxococcales bacterium]|jgi:hypothetical protein
MRSAIIAMACVIVVAAGTSACVTTCTAEARASVVVTVVDAAEKVVTDAKVTFRVDGGVEQKAECQGTYANMCDKWHAGLEDSGTFVIVATSADGTKRAEKTVVVKRDECHVQTELVMLVLE